MNLLDLSKMDFHLNQKEAHGKDYIHDLLCLMGDCVNNPEELEEFEYWADKVQSEYNFILDRLAQSENQRFIIGGNEE